MSEKKAKEERRMGPTPRCQFIITGLSDGSVAVEGPTDNFVLFRSMMCHAELAVLKKMREDSARRIIAPNPGLSVVKVG